MQLWRIYEKISALILSVLLLTSCGSSKTTNNNTTDKNNNSHSKITIEKKQTEHEVFGNEKMGYFSLPKGSNLVDSSSGT